MSKADTTSTAINNISLMSWGTDSTYYGAALCAPRQLAKMSASQQTINTLDWGLRLNMRNLPIFPGASVTGKQATMGPGPGLGLALFIPYSTTD